MLALFHTLSGVEFTWILVSFIGAFLSAWNIRLALGDYQAIEKLEIEDERRFLARAWIYTEGARLIIQTIFVGIGLWVALLPDVPTHSTGVIIMRTALILCSVLLSFKSVMHWQVRMVIRSRGQSNR